MLYFLGQLGEQLAAFNVFRYITFRTAGAVVTALFFVFLFGPGMIALLRVKQDPSFMGEMHLAAEERASVGLAQRVYSLGLDSLLEGSRALQPVGVRVYEMEGEAPRAFFDVTEDEQPRLLQMSASKNHLEPFGRGLTKALAMVEETDQEVELRLFRVPALNFEAVWLHYEDEARDTLLPLRGVGRLAPNEAVPFERAMDALREAARPRCFPLSPAG